MKQLFSCPACHTKYDPLAAHVLGRDARAQLLHMTCPHCANCILAWVHVGRVGASSVGMVTDLTYEDVLRFQDAEIVLIDDVLALHVQMENEGWISFFAHSDILSVDK